MKLSRKKGLIWNSLFTLSILLLVFVSNLLIVWMYDIHTLVPMNSVLGVFLIAHQTTGYLWGILAAFINVFAVNYAFTFPYYAFNFHMAENLFSAIVMMCVAAMTSALTTRIKRQEQMRTESEREKMRANLLRAISHDLRTPLTSISGSTSAIIENYDALTKEQHVKLLSEIREDSEWLIRMVENLLSVTRIDGGQVRVKKTPVLLDELLDAVLRKFQKRYPGQAVLLHLPEELLCVLVDPLLIEQVIINLLENAVLHAKGMTRLELRVYMTEGFAVFEITDDGTGISRDRLQRLFTGYHERTDTPTDGRRSMGIGLTVCATIIRAHGGIIEAENRPEGGARFRFTLQTEDLEENE